MNVARHGRILRKLRAAPCRSARRASLACTGASHRPLSRPSEQSRVQSFGLAIERDQVNLQHRRRGVFQRRDCDFRGTIRRKSKRTGRDRRERNRPQSKLVAKSQTASIARGKSLRLSSIATRPARTNGVEDVRRRQGEPGRYLRISGFASAKLGACGAQLGFTCGLVDRPVHSATGDQVLVGCVDDRVHPHTRDVPANDDDAKGSRVPTRHRATIPPGAVRSGVSGSLATLDPIPLLASDVGPDLADDPSRPIPRSKPEPDCESDSQHLLIPPLAQGGSMGQAGTGSSGCSGGTLGHETVPSPESVPRTPTRFRRQPNGVHSSTGWIRRFARCPRGSRLRLWSWSRNQRSSRVEAAPGLPRQGRTRRQGKLERRETAAESPRFHAAGVVQPARTVWIATL